MPFTPIMAIRILENRALIFRGGLLIAGETSSRSAIDELTDLNVVDIGLALQVSLDRLGPEI